MLELYESRSIFSNVLFKDLIMFKFEEMLSPESEFPSRTAIQLPLSGDLDVNALLMTRQQVRPGPK
jgi:hypothetical protein